MGHGKWTNTSTKKNQSEHSNSNDNKQQQTFESVRCEARWKRRWNVLPCGYHWGWSSAVLSGRLQLWIASDWKANDKDIDRERDRERGGETMCVIDNDKCSHWNNDQCRNSHLQRSIMLPSDWLMWFMDINCVHCFPLFMNHWLVNQCGWTNDRCTSHLTAPSQLYWLKAFSCWHKQDEWWSDCDLWLQTSLMVCPSE